MSNKDIVLDATADDAFPEGVDAAGTQAPDAPLEDKRGAIYAVPLDVVVSIGRASPTLGELAAFSRDTLLTLDAGVDAPVEIIVNGCPIAQGELQEIEGEDKLAVKITKIIDGNFS